MRTIDDRWQPAQRADSLLVLLPPAKATLEDLIAQGMRGTDSGCTITGLRLPSLCTAAWKRSYRPSTVCAPPKPIPT